MKDFYTVNFKEIVFAAEDASIYLDMEIEKAKAQGVKGFKIIHGYGSHGRGGLICINLRQYALKLKHQKKSKAFSQGLNGQFKTVIVLIFSQVANLHRLMKT